MKQFKSAKWTIRIKIIKVTQNREVVNFGPQKHKQ